ncbi:MAG: DUF484 family protein [Micavibrio sp.]
MSEIMTQPPQDEKQPSAEAVIAFLKGNPKFLQQHPQAMDYLIPPKNAGDRKVKDFQSFMIERLKQDKEKVLDTTRTIIDNARSNMNNQLRIQNVILRLLEAASFDEFIQIITMDMSAMLDTDISVLVVESTGDDIPHVHASGIRLVPPGTVDKWMAGKSALLQSNISGIEAIYGGAFTLVQSQALLRVDISMNTPPAILAFGSREPDMFGEGQATDQIGFLARIVERAFRLWLNR